MTDTDTDTEPESDPESDPESVNDGAMQVARMCVNCGRLHYASMSEVAGSLGLCAECYAAQGPRRGKPSPTRAPTAEVDALSPDPSGMQIIPGASQESRFREGSGRSSRKIALFGLLVFVALAFIAEVSFRGREIPPTPAGTQLEWLVGAMNASGEVTGEDIEERFSQGVVRSTSVGRILAQIVEWDERNDAYVIDTVLESSEPNRIVAILTNEAMERGRLTLETEAEEPYRITVFTIEAVDGPAE